MKLARLFVVAPRYRTAGSSARNSTHRVEWRYHLRYGEGRSLVDVAKETAVDMVGVMFVKPLEMLSPSANHHNIHQRTHQLR